MDLRNAFEALLSPKRRLWLIMGLGVCGMLMILFSRDPAQGSEALAEKPFTQSGGAGSAGDYTERLEEKLGGMIGEIEGVGAVRVMITLANSGELVFAREERRDAGKQSEPASEELGAGRISEQENTQQSYVIVEGENGRRQALVQTQLEPAVRGVVIVCEGAGDIYVQSRVVNVVTTAFGIPSTRVCVEPMGSAS